MIHKVAAIIWLTIVTVSLGLLVVKACEKMGVNSGQIN